VRRDPLLQERFVQQASVLLPFAEGPCLLGTRLCSAGSDESSLSALLPWLDVLQLLDSASLC